MELRPQKAAGNIRFKQIETTCVATRRAFSFPGKQGLEFGSFPNVAGAFIPAGTHAEAFTMTKTIAWIAGGAIAGYLMFWGVPEFFQRKEDPRSRAHLSRIAAELSQSVPVMIDKETELFVVEGQEALLIYQYRLVPYSLGQIDHEKFAAGAKQRLTQGVCSQPNLREDYLKQGVTLRYSYFDKDKRHIATVDVTPADCGFSKFGS